MAAAAAPAAAAAADVKAPNAAVAAPAPAAANANAAAAARYAGEPKTKIAVVTGGNKGIGFAVAKALARLGPVVHVVLTARSDKDGAAAVAQLHAAGLTNVEYALLDVNDDTSIDTFVSGVLTKHKRVDWLVNNSGVLPDWGVPVLETNVAHVQAAFTTNTLGPLKLSMKLVPQMKANGYGRVVNMSSGSGQLSHMNGKHIAYRLSKTALNVVTRVFGDELKGTNVHVNSMCPGFVLSDMTKHIIGANPTKTPDEGADTAVWLCQQDATGPNGGFFRNRAPLDW